MKKTAEILSYILNSKPVRALKATKPFQVAVQLRDVLPALKRPKNSKHSFLAVLAGIGLEDIGIGSLAGAFILGVTIGTIAGLAGIAAIPVAGAILGAEFSTSLLGASVLNSIQFLGFSGTAWLGGIIGAVAGTALNMLPLSPRRLVKSTAFKLNNQELQITDEDKANGFVKVPLSDVPMIRISETQIQANTRVYDVAGTIPFLTIGGLSAIFGGVVIAIGMGGAKGIGKAGMALTEKRASPSPN